MKTILPVSILAILVSGSIFAAEVAKEAPAATAILNTTQEKTMTLQDVYQFLQDAKTYYIATVDGDQPRVRPFGTSLLFEGKLYIQTGRKKNVSKQLAINGKTEICAMRGDEWIRITGTLVDDDRREPKVAMLEAYPSLKGMYDPDDGNTQVLYFKDATAVIASFSHPPVEVKF